MAQYDISVSGNQLIIELIVTDGDFAPSIVSIKNPSIKLTTDRIKFYDSGVYNMALFFNQINEIDGVAPTDLEDAADKIIALIANFNGGGAAPQNTTTQQTTQTSGTNPTPDTQDDLFVIHEADVTASLAIPFPANPRNAQQFYIHSVGGITALTLTATVGTILSIATTITAGATIGWIYNQISNKWYKIR